ncbi:MAG: hypothetical protein ACLSDT_10105 [Blautia sp.]
MSTPIAAYTHMHQRLLTGVFGLAAFGWRLWAGGFGLASFTYRQVKL